MVNYRGISLVHTMLKVFSKVVTQRLTRIAENCGLLCTDPDPKTWIGELGRNPSIKETILDENRVVLV